MMRASLLAMCLFLAVSFAGESFFNVINSENGDFGGLPFPLRNELTTFIDTDFAGDVTSFGFYLPSLSRSGLDSLDPMGPPLGATLEFDTSSLPNPEQFPFTFVGINFNPGGHPGLEYLVPHFDIHLWLEAPEYARGIQCNGTDFPPCSATPYLVERFSKTADSKYYPAGYQNNPAEWVPTMGAHLIPNPIPNTFATVPAYIYGSYNGKLIYYEPMVANTIFEAAELNGPQVFDWPSTQDVPRGGRFFSKISVEYESGADRYKFSFTDLWTAPQKVNSVPVFTGMAYIPNEEALDSAPSTSKDCLIAAGSVVDSGYKVVSDGKTFCCRGRADFSGGSCSRSTCTGSAPATSPATAHFSFGSGPFCYFRCHEA